MFMNLVQKGFKWMVPKSNTGQFWAQTGRSCDKVDGPKAPGSSEHKKAVINVVENKQI